MVDFVWNIGFIMSLLPLYNQIVLFRKVDLIPEHLLITMNPCIFFIGTILF